jgi:crotonobetainyl-CoA:carnitine CoA-transferase CaiB-like acyl-CoA transferase
MRCSCCLLFQHLHQVRLEGPDRLHALQAHPHGAHGTRSPYKPAAPHGVYPCTGEDHWLAIACFTEAEWRALTRVAGHPEWAADSRFVDFAARLAHQDALDALVGGWTQSQDAYQAMYRLQQAGVPGGVCQTAEDRCDHDPQLAALNWLTEVTGTKIGRWPVAEVAVKMSASPAYIGGRLDRGAPCYGEDNDYVYGELLGCHLRRPRLWPKRA